MCSPLRRVWPGRCFGAADPALKGTAPEGTNQAAQHLSDFILEAFQELAEPLQHYFSIPDFRADPEWI